MSRIAVIVLVAFYLSILKIEGQTRHIVIADSTTHKPLPSASIFDRHGNTLGISKSNGTMPYIQPEAYPITIRYLGFKEATVHEACSDTVFLQENISELPEVVVESRQHKVLHMLAYVREYSNLTTYTDSIFLFREKMVDFMLPSDRKMKFKGWSNPRVISCKSYYRFKDRNGLDSVSDRSGYHFSWSDWIGIPQSKHLPLGLSNVDNGADTISGKYGVTEIWSRKSDRVTVNVNVLADTTSRRWVPNLAGFFRNELDFEHFKVKYNYRDVVTDSLSPLDLTGFSFNIESNGRGHDMFRFHRFDQPFYVSTYAEVYMLDKEYITVKEARKWEDRKFDTDEIGILEPAEAPELRPEITELVARVNDVDKDGVRLEFPPDYRLISNHKRKGRRNFQLGQRALMMLKDVTGITSYKYHKNMKRRWDELKMEAIRKNKNLTEEE